MSAQCACSVQNLQRTLQLCGVTLQVNLSKARACLAGLLTHDLLATGGGAGVGINQQGSRTLDMLHQLSYLLEWFPRPICPSMHDSQWPELAGLFDCMHAA